MINLTINLKILSLVESLDSPFGCLENSCIKTFLALSAKSYIRSKDSLARSSRNILLENEGRKPPITKFGSILHSFHGTSGFYKKG